jgi:hypothetical protein
MSLSIEGTTITADKVLVLGVTLLVLLLFLALPAIIALVRRHPGRKLIAQLTPLTLVSFLLWIALLVWAVSDKRDDATLSKYVAWLRGSWRLPAAIGVLVLLGLAGTVIALRG